MTIPMKQPTAEDAIESALMQGDLSKLSAPQRLEHYRAVCKSLGLNPLTQPFAYIVLNGKLQLYALRNCADQLREIKKVSLQIVSRDVADGMLDNSCAGEPAGWPLRRGIRRGAVHREPQGRGARQCRAEMHHQGRSDGPRCPSAASAGFRRREVESIPGARKPPEPAPDVSCRSGGAGQPVKPAAELLEAARSFAKRGSKEFTAFYRPLTQAQRDALVPHGAELRELMNEADADIARDEAVPEHDPETGEVA